MRYTRFIDPAGHVRKGEWTEDGVSFADHRYDREDVEILPPVEPTKVVCLASNYVEHIREGSEGSEIPEVPSVFLKAPNAVTSHDSVITLPTPRASAEELPDVSGVPLGDRVDYEAEIGVVIGKQCKLVSQEDAGDVITGYTCVNDVSNRDDQFVYGTSIRGKAFDSAAPMGPVVATPEHVPDNPRVRLWLNGELKQDSADDRMVFSPPEAIEEITKFVTLEPGDVISMGTTYGVGPLSDGDTVEIEVEGVGPRLRNHFTTR